MAAYHPVFQHAKITSRDPNTRLVVTHHEGCRALDSESCRCEPQIRIVRPARKRGRT